MVVARVGMSGGDEDLHGGYGIVLCPKQLSVMVAGVGICTKERCAMSEGTNF